MALEAGATMHQVFAAVRIWQLEHVQKLPKHALFTAERIFGKERWRGILKQCDSHNDREQLLQLAFAVLHSSGWEDDLRDKNRTMSNMELSSVHYIDERIHWMEDWPVYVKSKQNHRQQVGVEQVFDVTVLYEDDKKIRFIGTIDGLVINKRDGKYYLDENKTANRLDDGWRQSFDMSMQVTGYCASCTVVFGFPVYRSRVTGVTIKPGKEEPYVGEPIERDEYSFRVWARWLRWTVELHEEFKDDFENAPRFAHSCNRYFRPCALIPFCCDTPEGRKEQFEQMVPVTPSPSEQAIMEGE